MHRMIRLPAPDDAGHTVHFDLEPQNICLSHVVRWFPQYAKPGEPSTRSTVVVLVGGQHLTFADPDDRIDEALCSAFFDCTPESLFPPTRGARRVPDPPAEPLVDEGRQRLLEVDPIYPRSQIVSKAQAGRMSDAEIEHELYHRGLRCDDPRLVNVLAERNRRVDAAQRQG